ncbi:hypothetical protein K505DRAFT_372538, partial [Melanomma pulvis-pyrius CBS 109.77]
SQRLGLENFTVHPVTPALPIVPIAIPLPADTYALRIPALGDDLGATPYLAALEPASASSPRRVALKTIYVPSPEAEDVDGACPEGFECTADAFSVYGDGGRKKLAYGGFEGRWSAVKDAGREGWHVYWREGVAPGPADVEIEIVAGGKGG